jgi:hypothetical protein
VGGVDGSEESRLEFLRATTVMRSSDEVFSDKSFISKEV